MGHGALLLGHSRPEVVSAVRDQAGRFFHPGANHELESDWAELVIRLVPSAERVRFTSSGTEASLLALRVARAATGRDKIVKLSGHFHGWHDQVAVGSDPPFDRPDTAGLPRATADTVTVIPADTGALAGALQAGDVRGGDPRAVRSGLGHRAAAGRVSGRGAAADRRRRCAARLRRGGVGLPVGARRRPGAHRGASRSHCPGKGPGRWHAGRRRLRPRRPDGPYRRPDRRPAAGGAPGHAQRPRAVGRGRRRPRSASRRRGSSRPARTGWPRRCARSSPRRSRGPAWPAAPTARARHSTCCSGTTGRPTGSTPRR